MTKKQFKVWDEEKWGEVRFVGRLEQLEHEASQLRGRFKICHYIVSTPTPPWMLKEGEQPTMTTVTRRRFSKELAEELIATKGDFAHFYALEKLEGYVSDPMRELWRDVLTWLDELGGNDGGGVDKDRNGCGEEP